MPKTKKAKKVAGSKLIVDSLSKVDSLKSILKNGNITFVLVFADWCGHCHNFMDNIWNPTCKKGPFKNNAVAVREDILPSTPLANAKIEGYPSVIKVTPDGTMKEYKDETGKATNAMTTPQSKTEMEKILNTENRTPTPYYANQKNIFDEEEDQDQLFTQPALTTEAITNTNIMKTRTKTNTPEGITYTPAFTPPFTQEKQKGGSLLQTLEQIGSGTLPMKVLYKKRRCTTKRKSCKQRKTRKVRK